MSLLEDINNGFYQQRSINDLRDAIKKEFFGLRGHPKAEELVTDAIKRALLIVSQQNDNPFAFNTDVCRMAYTLFKESLDLRRWEDRENEREPPMTVEKAEKELASALKDFAPIYNSTVAAHAPGVAKAISELISALMNEKKSDK